MEKVEINAQKELYKAHLEFLGWNIKEDPEDEQDMPSDIDPGCPGSIWGLKDIGRATQTNCMKTWVDTASSG